MCTQSESFDIIKTCAWTVWLLGNIIAKIVSRKAANTCKTYFAAEPWEYIDEILSRVRDAPAAQQDDLIRDLWPEFGLTTPSRHTS